MKPTIPIMLVLAVLGRPSEGRDLAEVAGKESMGVVSRHHATWTIPPHRTPADHAVDGPLMGNGDMKVAVGGPPETQTFFLAKNDFWRLQSQAGRSSPVGFGHLALQIPALAGAGYEMTQSWSVPETVGRFVTRPSSGSADTAVVRMRSMVAATENILLVELTAEGRAVDARAVLRVASGRGSASRAERKGDVLWGQREFREDVDIPSGVAVACRTLGATTPATKQAAAGLQFTIQPGRPVILALAMDSAFANESYADDVVGRLSGLSDPSALRNAHAAWWADYWAKSWVDIGDPVIEAAYYRSLYHMGALSRDPRFPPGIFGVVTTDHPRWAGDYHLNYNHLAPFYALYSANRIAQADPEDAPILGFRERGRWYAEHVTGTRGVLYPVGIGPLGIETTRSHNSYTSGPNAEQGGLFFQQRSNSAYCLVNIAQRWRTTYDPAYGRNVYPFVREVVEFWDDYLVWEDGRYVIYGDAIHEGSGQNRNPILSLGLVRNALDLALDMSEELGVDADRREKWRHILAHLSSWTTQVMDGKTVFRYTEKGTHWWRDNTLGIQHIYPGNALGLDSDPAWIKVAHHTIDVMQRWIDFNGSNSFFPAAVRVGYDAETILQQLGRYVRNTYPNGFMKGNPHGIENYSTVPNTINEMLCMSHVPVDGSHHGMIRVFPVWPKDRDARFVDLRAWGAFLVSSELKSGNVQYVNILSERGRDCTVVNPWPERPVSVTRGQKKETLFGDRLTFPTAAGDRITLTSGAKKPDHGERK